MILNLYSKIKQQLSQITEIKSINLKLKERDRGTILVAHFVSIDIDSLDLQTLPKGYQQAHCYINISIYDKCFDEKTGQENQDRIMELEKIAKEINLKLHNFQGELINDWKNFNSLVRVKYDITKDNSFLSISQIFKTIIYDKLK